MYPKKPEATLSRFKWHIAVVIVVVTVVVILTVFTNTFKTPEASLLLELLRFMLLIVVLIGLISILPILHKLQSTAIDNGDTLARIVEAVEKNRGVLEKIKQNSLLSETAKSIASRDVDRQSLREAVLEKLHQQEFTSTYEIINEISRAPMYSELASQLKAEADNYRDATDQEKINQVIAHVEGLFEGARWAKAGLLIERLIAQYPKSERAKAMRQELVDKKDAHKKELLQLWDESVKKQDVDRSLEILRELDMYLTPNEGLALQEAARDVFRNKLHNLGVQFSMSVSERNWPTAVQTGKQIVRDFPNSKMAQEIREKMAVLEQKYKQQMGQ